MYAYIIGLNILRESVVVVLCFGGATASTVPYGNPSDARAQVLGVGRDCERGLRRRFHQQVVDHPFLF